MQFSAASIQLKCVPSGLDNACNSIKFILIPSNCSPIRSRATPMLLDYFPLNLEDTPLALSDAPIDVK